MLHILFPSCIALFMNFLISICSVACKNKNFVFSRCQFRLLITFQFAFNLRRVGILKLSKPYAEALAVPVMPLGAGEVGRKSVSCFSISSSFVAEAIIFARVKLRTVLTSCGHSLEGYTPEGHPQPQFHPSSESRIEELFLPRWKTPTHAHPMTGLRPIVVFDYNFNLKSEPSEIDVVHRRKLENFREEA